MKNQYDFTVRFFGRYRVSFIELSFILIQEIRNQKEKPAWISNNIRELGSVSNSKFEMFMFNGLLQNSKEVSRT